MVKYTRIILTLRSSLRVKALALLCALPFLAHTHNNDLLAQDPKKKGEVRSRMKGGAMWQQENKKSETARQKAKRQKRSVTFKYRPEKEPKPSKHKILPKT